MKSQSHFKAPTYSYTTTNELYTASRLLCGLHMSDISGYLKVSAKTSCHNIMCKSIPGFSEIEASMRLTWNQQYSKMNQFEKLDWGVNDEPVQHCLWAPLHWGPGASCPCFPPSPPLSTPLQLYHSLTKDCPWVEHLTSLPKKEVSTLWSASQLTTKCIHPGVTEKCPHFTDRMKHPSLAHPTGK